jgi:hypothetical protein
MDRQAAEISATNLYRLANGSLRQPDFRQAKR